MNLWSLTSAPPLWPSKNSGPPPLWPSGKNWSPLWPLQQILVHCAAATEFFKGTLAAASVTQWLQFLFLGEPSIRGKVSKLHQFFRLLKVQSRVSSWILNVGVKQIFAQMSHVGWKNGLMSCVGVTLVIIDDGPWKGQSHSQSHSLNSHVI